MEKLQMRAKTDLIGRRFGRLIVTAAARNEKKELVWQCKCDCGNTTVAKTGHLNAGLKISCGCIKKEKQKDLVGKRFGRLLVLEKSGQKDPRSHSILWKCQCECGNLCVKPTNELNAGLATSCGCAWRCSSIRVGERYGRLIALGPTDKRINRTVIWNCRCDCGNSVEVKASLLHCGKVKSCGCIKAEQDKDRFLKNLTFVDNTCLEFLTKINVPTKASTTGVRGVTQKKDGRYKAELTFQKKHYYLGVYATLEEAAKARKQAEVMVEEYLENHEEELHIANRLKGQRRNQG